MSSAPPVGVFAALADPSRHLLLQALAGHAEGASATQLAAPLPVSRQAVDKHLRVLHRAGLVSSTRRSREVRYALRREELDNAAAWLSDLARSWDRRLASIKAAAEAPHTTTNEPDGSDDAARGGTR